MPAAEHCAGRQTSDGLRYADRASVFHVSGRLGCCIEATLGLPLRQSTLDDAYVVVLGVLVFVARIDDVELLPLVLRNLFGEDGRATVVNEIKIRLHLVHRRRLVVGEGGGSEQQCTGCKRGSQNVCEFHQVSRGIDPGRAGLILGWGSFACTLVRKIVSIKKTNTENSFFISTSLQRSEEHTTEL